MGKKRGSYKKSSSHNTSRKFDSVAEEIRESLLSGNEAVVEIPHSEKFDPVAFREYLENTYEFEDVELAEQQIGVMAKFISSLKQQNDNGTLTSPLPTECSMKCLSEMRDADGSKQKKKDLEHCQKVVEDTDVTLGVDDTMVSEEGLVQDQWSKLFVNELAAQGMGLSYIAPEVREGRPIAKLKV